MNKRSKTKMMYINKRYAKSNKTHEDLFKRISDTFKVYMDNLPDNIKSPPWSGDHINRKKVNYDKNNNSRFPII